jgi:hypothetical protein
VGENAKRFAFAVLLCESGEQFLSLGVVSEKQDSGLRKCPLEVDVADFLSASAELLTGRFLGAFHQTTIRDVTRRINPGEAGDSAASCSMVSSARY